jgi:hypothetical protein
MLSTASAAGPEPGGGAMIGWCGRWRCGGKTNGGEVGKANAGTTDRFGEEKSSRDDFGDPLGMEPKFWGGGGQCAMLSGQIFLSVRKPYYARVP